MRRLRGMLESLIKTLPPERAAALLHEVKALKKTTERLFSRIRKTGRWPMSAIPLGVGGTRDRDEIDKAKME